MNEYQFDMFRDLNNPEINNIKIDLEVGDICICILPCPERMIAGECCYGYVSGCYNYLAEVEIIDFIVGDRAICKDVGDDHANHNGWTIVPVEFLELKVSR